MKLGPNSIDALRLKNYRAPTSSSKNVATSSKNVASTSQNVAGDFAEVLFSVVKDRAYDGESVSVLDLNQKFVSTFLKIPKKFKK